MLLRDNTDMAYGCCRIEKCNYFIIFIDYPYSFASLLRDHTKWAFFFFGQKFELGQGRSLSQIPLFSSLSGTQIRLLEKKVRSVEFKKGDWLYHKGEESKAFYVIVSGRVRIYQEAEGEPPKILATLYRGDYFGETAWRSR